MRTPLVAFAVLTLGGSVAIGQTMGVFADPLGTDCNLTIHYPGPPVTVYVVGTLEGPASEGVTGAVFRITGLPAGWIAGVTPDPTASVFIGNPFADGAWLAYGSCITSGPRVLLAITVTPTSEVQDVALSVLPNLLSPDSCGFEGGGCGRSCARFCSCDVFTRCYCATALVSHINGQPCGVAVASEAWGAVKRIYH